MAEDREDDKLVWVTLNAAMLAQLEREAAAAGRTPEKQILYMVEVALGLTLPDPGDRAGTQQAQLYRRMVAHRPLNG